MNIIKNISGTKNSKKNKFILAMFAENTLLEVKCEQWTRKKGIKTLKIIDGFNLKASSFKVIIRARNFTNTFKNGKLLYVYEDN